MRGGESRLGRPREATIRRIDAWTTAGVGVGLFEQGIGGGSRDGEELQLAAWDKGEAIGMRIHAASAAGQRGTRSARWKEAESGRRAGRRCVKTSLQGRGNGGGCFESSRAGGCLSRTR